MHFINMLIASDCYRMECLRAHFDYGFRSAPVASSDFAAAELPRKHVHNRSMLQTEFAWISNVTFGQNMKSMRCVDFDVCRWKSMCIPNISCDRISTILVTHGVREEVSLQQSLLSHHTLTGSSYCIGLRFMCFKFSNPCLKCSEFWKRTFLLDFSQTYGGTNLSVSSLIHWFESISLGEMTEVWSGPKLTYTRFTFDYVYNLAPILRGILKDVGRSDDSMENVPTNALPHLIFEVRLFYCTCLFHFIYMCIYLCIYIYIVYIVLFIYYYIVVNLFSYMHYKGPYRPFVNIICMDGLRSNQTLGSCRQLQRRSDRSWKLPSKWALKSFKVCQKPPVFSRFSCLKWWLKVETPKTSLNIDSFCKVMVVLLLGIIQLFLKEPVIDIQTGTYSSPSSFYLQNFSNKFNLGSPAADLKEVPHENSQFPAVQVYQQKNPQDSESKSRRKVIILIMAAIISGATRCKVATPNSNQK